MHDYLKKAQLMLEPPKGDFTAFVQRLQQNKLAALSPDIFAEGDDALTPGSIIARSTRRSREKLFGRRAKSAPAMGQSTYSSAAAQAPAGASRQRQTGGLRPPQQAGRGAGPLPSTQRKERSKNQGSFSGFFVALPLFVFLTTFFQFGDPSISAVATFVTAFLFIVFAGLMRRFKRRNN